MGRSWVDGGWSEVSAHIFFTGIISTEQCNAAPWQYQGLAERQGLCPEEMQMWGENGAAQTLCGAQVHHGCVIPASPCEYQICLRKRGLFSDSLLWPPWDAVNLLDRRGLVCLQLFFSEALPQDFVSIANSHFTICILPAGRQRRLKPAAFITAARSGWERAGWILGAGVWPSLHPPWGSQAEHPGCNLTWGGFGDDLIKGSLCWGWIQRAEGWEHCSPLPQVAQQCCCR